ncbi:ABC transporter substrate-binding protein [Leifsonia sp. Root227]|jgi:multiple sugar transport system substrate-binding protein|uniref:ABC transporter substrate-binding protein n=1 Tax=unclassified Leifsonia TaxID=2663824 RepID=UPI0006FB42F0|nr:extracellular solute-binding protein [Leifsonia sp. Root227]KRC51624.1 ABC transporter substrate-binding protein [Leifsonia sp. Root227]
MRSRIALGAVAGLAVIGLALSGCSSSGSTGSSTSGKVDGKGKTLDVMIAANSLYPTEQQQWFKDVSAQFQKETGATVKFETFASANDELTKIQTSVLSGQGPDIYDLGTTFTPTAYSTGAFVKLTDDDWKKVGGRDRFVPATLGISGPDEKNEVGIPFLSRPFVMAYNKDLLKAAGIDKPADTWDGLADQAKKLTSGDVHGMAVAYADSFDPWKFVWAMAMQQGNTILDLKSKKATIDDDAVKKAYETYFGWLTDDKVVDPAAIGWKNANAVAAFADGKAAFLPMVSSSSQVSLDKSSVAGKYGYAVMPTIPPGETKLPSDGKAAATIISGDNMVVAKYSKNQDLAFALVKMLTSTDNQVKYTKTFGDLPTNADAAKQIESGNELIAPILDAGTKAYGTPFSGAWGDTQLALVNVVVQSIPSLSNGSVSSSDLEAKLKTAQDTAQSSLNKAK